MKNKLSTGGDRSLLTLGCHLALLSLTTITRPQDHPLPKQLSTHLFIHSFQLFSGLQRKQNRS